MFDPTEVHDSSPYSPESVERRLRAARVLSKAGIKCLVWGEDALAFVHFVPTVLFGLHLVVSEDDVVRASNAITASLPYEVYTPFNDTYVDSRTMNPSQPLIYPRSVHLRTKPEDEDDPETILIHPHSEVAIDLDDPLRSVTLPPFPSNILFPTRVAFIDCILDHILDPPNGREFFRLSLKISSWLAYFYSYTLPVIPSVLPNGDIEPERKKVMRALKPENQAYFEYELRSLAKNTTFKIISMDELRMQQPTTLMKIIPSLASLAVYCALSTLMTSATPVPTNSDLDVGESRPLNSRNIHDATALLTVAPSEDWFAPIHHLRETCASGSLGLTPAELENPQQTIDNIEMELMTKEKGSEIMTLYRQQISLSVKAIEIAIEQAERSSLQLFLDFVNFHGYISKAQMSHREPNGATKADQEQLETTIHSCTGSLLEVLDRKIAAAVGGARVGNLSQSDPLINVAANLYIERLLALWARVNEGDEGEMDVVIVQRLRETYRAALNFRKYFGKVHGLNGQMSQSMTLASEALKKAPKVNRGSEKKPVLELLLGGNMSLSVEREIQIVTPHRVSLRIADIG
ncbi:hypothetical protein H0H93_008511 [Arthromyces matolae]|nr:hypothetical protein H0H93_008511 [Arthromyces matolae]